MADKKPYDSTLARIAGNIAAGMIRVTSDHDHIANASINIAKRIVRQLTEEQAQQDGTRE